MRVDPEMKTVQLSSLLKLTLPAPQRKRDSLAKRRQADVNTEKRKGVLSFPMTRHSDTRTRLVRAATAFAHYHRNSRLATSFHVSFPCAGHGFVRPPPKEPSTSTTLEANFQIQRTIGKG